MSNKHPQTGLPLTELDFRMPEYYHAKVEDYEFRADGKIVRKDRWETGIRHIASALDMNGCDGFEIEEVVSAVKTLTGRKPLAYLCPHHCGCLWRDNANGTMSLFGENSKSCTICEFMGLDDLIPLFI